MILPLYDIMNQNYICHHGRLGQKWGEKNGPPYPLSSSAVKKAYGKKKTEKKQIDEAEEKKRHEANRERVLREGSATEVMEYVNEMSNQELQNALNRIRWTNQLAEISSKELEKGWNTVDDVMKKIGKIKDWSKVSVELFETIDKAIQISKKYNTSTSASKK